MDAILFWDHSKPECHLKFEHIQQLNSGHVQLSSPPPLTSLFLGAIVKTCFGYIKTQLHLLKCYCCLVFGPQHITMSENSTFVWYLDAIPILEHLTSRQL